MGCRPENHRIQRITLYDNIPAFFFLFAVLLFLFSTTTLASYPDDESMERHVMDEISSPSSNQSRDRVYFYKLYNRCSGRHVSVRQRLIQARANWKSHYAWLRIEPVTFGGRIRIRSNTSHFYLCFNAAGNLTVKRSAEGRRSCTFIEIHLANGDFQFQSDANPSWRLGFNDKGKRMAGNQWKRERNHRKCSQFARTEYKVQTPNGTVDVEPPNRTPDEAAPGSPGAGEVAQQWHRDEQSKHEKRPQIAKKRKPK